MTAAPFELCSGMFLSASYPPPCHELILCLWGTLLTAALAPLTPPAVPEVQLRQVVGRGLAVFCEWCRSHTGSLPAS